ncbi:MAG: alpha-mannosidase [Chloroflexi bacterium]|nr:alpha-mannosidase [Chloroflexota bacterium]
MALTLEWRRRIENWLKEMPAHLYTPLGSIELEGFITLEQLSPLQALGREFSAFPVGTQWGAKWEYAWFKAQVVLPPEARGKRIVMRLDPGGESAVFVDGIAVGAVDNQHTEITLTRAGIPGTNYAMLCETYAGHGPRVVSAGPVGLGRETVPEPPETQVTVGHSTFGIWEEELYQLWMDVRTLLGVRDNIDANSLRVVEIDAGLRDFTLLVDLEADYDTKLAGAAAARARLKPLLDAVNGSTAPLLYTFGHSHIDVAWLWPLAETERKTARTFGTQLALMDEYPEFKFIASEPHIFRWVKNNVSELYQRVQEAAARGQFIPEGGMWVEADTNISGGEALIRQFVHGQRYYGEEFGVRCEMLWLPDVFGYSGALPQILQGSGIKYFSTAKIFWAYNGGDPFPYNTFCWEGIDGTGVLVHLMNDYNSHTDPASLIERWNGRVQKDGINARLVPFGYGDGGGGPTRDHLEFLRRMRNLEGVPRTTMQSPIDYFHDLEANNPPKERYVGELYFQAHRGTYTSQARTKRGNRKSEFALHDAELWGAVASVLGGYNYPAERIDTAWKGVLLNQFHDIIPGSSIHRVYKEAEALYAEIIADAQAVRQEAEAVILNCNTTMLSPHNLTVFNPTPWARCELVALPEGANGAIDAHDQPLPSQEIDGRRYTAVKAVPMGWTTITVSDHSAAVEAPVNACERCLENSMIKAEFNARGELTSVYDKESGRELLAGVGNQMHMYKDVPTNWDAWDLDSTYMHSPVPLEEPAEISVLAKGPLVAKLRVRRKLNNSWMTQEISLRAGSRRIDFATTIDWQERHKLLKVAFPVTIFNTEALHEIQFGHIARPTHASRPFDADRFEVVNHKWTALTEQLRGCSVLNDCKYGVNVIDNTIALTLLKSALAPDMTADRGEQVFTYAFYAWNGPFSDSGLVREGYALNLPVTVANGGSGERSLMSLDAENVVLEWVKPAEDGSGDVILRLYEAQRTATRTKLNLDLPVKMAWVTNMLEEKQAEIAVQDGTIALDLRPFEICTLRMAF